MQPIDTDTFRIDFQTLADIIDGLRIITGKPVKLTDLLDYSDEAN